MDTPSHIIQGALMIGLPIVIIGGIPIWLLVILMIVFGLIGGIPDLYGEYMAHIKGDNYKWYASIHFGEIKNKLFKYDYIPFLWPIILHIYLDKFGHGEGKRWWCINERGWIEICNWIVNIILIYIFILYIVAK